MKASLLISMEGMDNVGKTTHAKRLLGHLDNAGFDAVYVKSPSVESVFYKEIYEALESGWAVEHPYLFQGMQLANKLHFQHFHLPRLRNEMDVIIMDRWDVSMQAYGVATGIPLPVIRTMSAMLVKPDQVFILRGSGGARRSPRDAYESNDELQKTVSAFYNSNVWRTSYGEVTDVDVMDDPDDTFESILREFKF